MEGLQALAVLVGLDLAPRQPFGQDLLGTTPRLLVRLWLVGLARPPQQSDREHGDQRSEAEHANGGQAAEAARQLVHGRDLLHAMDPRLDQAHAIRWPTWSPLLRW